MWAGLGPSGDPEGEAVPGFLGAPGGRGTPSVPGAVCGAFLRSPCSHRMSSVGLFCVCASNIPLFLLEGHRSLDVGSGLSLG